MMAAGSFRLIFSEPDSEHAAVTLESEESSVGPIGLAPEDAAELAGLLEKMFAVLHRAHSRRASLSQRPPAMTAAPASAREQAVEDVPEETPA
jgi:hypothetical protein